jgi:hypothetical protein
MLPHVVDLSLVVFDPFILKLERQRSRERNGESETERYGTFNQNKMIDEKRTK